MPLLLLNLILLLFFILLNFFIIFITKANTYCFFFFDIRFLDLMFIFIFILIFLSLKTKHLITTLLCILFIFIFFSFGLFSIFVQLPTLMFIIVYLGALMMLFVFVVMLFSAQQNKINVASSKIFGFLLFSLFAFKIAKTLQNSNELITTLTFTKTFEQMDLWTIFFLNHYTLNGNTLFIYLFTKMYTIYFILLTFILLATLIVAITIIFLTKPFSNTQEKK